MVAEKYEIDFYIIFWFEAAQNMVAQHYEKDFRWFSTLRLHKTGNLDAEHYERFWHDFPL